MENLGNTGPVTGTTRQVDNWINDASPEDLIRFGRTVLGKIAMSGEQHLDTFRREVQSDPQASKLFNKQDA